MTASYETDVRKLLRYTDEQWDFLLTCLQYATLPTPRPVVRLHPDYIKDDQIEVREKRKYTRKRYEPVERHPMADTMSFADKRHLVLGALAQGKGGNYVSQWLNICPSVVSKIKHGKR